MKQADCNTNNASSKGAADKAAVLPTENSPKKSSQANQGGNAKSGDSQAAGKGNRTDAAKTNKQGNQNKR